MKKTNRDLIIFNEAAPNPVVSALEKSGFEVVQHVWEPTEEQLGRLFFAWIYFYDCIKYPLKVRRLRRKIQGHAPLVAWNRDAPSYKGRPGWRVRMTSWLRPLDIYMSHSLTDGMCFGDRQLYLPNAVNPHLYNLAGTTLEKLGQPDSYDIDVSFFGGLDATRHPGQLRRKIFLDALAQRLTAEGISHLFTDGQGLDAAEQIKLIQRSRINLQYGASCEYPGHTAGGLPERCYGVPACGGFLLADKRAHACDDFELGKNYVEFDSLDDCMEKIRHYLADFKAMRSLAEASHHHVLAHHCYQHRADSVIAAVEQWWK